jgi:hypothetical protein
MRIILILAALFICGCTHSPPLSYDEKEAEAQVEKWVPVGTPLVDAQRIMELHRFKCQLERKSKWRNSRDADLIFCSFDESSPGVNASLITRWQVALFLENDKVQSVDVVIIGLSGP